MQAAADVGQGHLLYYELSGYRGCTECAFCTAPGDDHHGKLEDDRGSDWLIALAAAPLINFGSIFEIVEPVSQISLSCWPPRFFRS